MKKLNLILLLLFLQNSLVGQQIHFLTVADVKDQDFAMATNKGYYHFIKIFKTINTNMGFGPINEVYLSAEKMTSLNIKKSIANFKIKPNDIIVFYYSGKGYFPSSSISEYPNLTLNDSKKNPLSFDEVSNLLKAKGARLAIAIADGRDTKLKLEDRKIEDHRDTETANNNRAEIIKHLINTTCGLVKISSNIKNTPALVVSNRIKIFKVPNSNEYKKVVDPNEYSVFSVSFVEVFERILQKARALYKFNGLLRAVEYRMNKELNPIEGINRNQELVWEIQSCGKTSSANNVFVNLEEDLNDLLVIKNLAKRQNFIAKMIDKYKDLKTSYDILRIGNSETSASISKGILSKNKLEYYLNTLNEYNPKIMSIVIIEEPKLTEDNPITKMEEFYSE